MLILYSKIKELILNQQTSNSLLLVPSLSCLKIDTVYKKAVKIQESFQKDTSGITKKKLECFRKSIFLPFSSYDFNLLV